MGIPGALGAREGLDRAMRWTGLLRRRGKAEASVLVVSAEGDDVGELIADHEGFQFLGELDHGREPVGLKPSYRPPAKVME